eukprot:jgi/Undpi1/10263/HiC_scaffold_28.g12715.m1
MAEFFKLSIVNENTLGLLNDVMVLKKRMAKDIRRLFRVEFIYIFFGILRSLLRRGKHIGDLGYVTAASPSDMRKAFAALEARASSIAKRFGACFKLHALKKARPRMNLFPADGAFSQATTGSDYVSFNESTVDTLKQCLFDTTKKDEFLDIIFAIISHAQHVDKTLARMKVCTAKHFFLKEIYNEDDPGDVREAASMQEGRRLRQEIVFLREELASANEKGSTLIKTLTSSMNKEIRLLQEIVILRKELAAENMDPGRDDKPGENDNHQTTWLKEKLKEKDEDLTAKDEEIS